ncbi:DUF2783 domain-containing protein [Emcibacter sp.]|uniref:DUF2783 domain-containing protein n=1 Tax=Emcibacter sp. TaxID=1979954 RepID=UPI002AA7C8BF|nr:DUF2783 domain-containing protein [Emcibacter sp.]
MTGKTNMPFEELEKIYDRLAEALDKAGEDKHALFLARLVMVLAQQSGDPEMVREAIRNASDGLPQE